MAPETANIIIATAITCIASGAAITAFMGRFVTKDDHRESTKRLEQGIESIGESLHELTAVVSDLKVINERIGAAHQRIDAIEMTNADFHRRSKRKDLETYG